MTVFLLDDHEIVRRGVREMDDRGIRKRLSERFIESFELRIKIYCPGLIAFH